MTKKQNVIFWIGAVTSILLFGISAILCVSSAAEMDLGMALFAVGAAIVGLGIVKLMKFYLNKIIKNQGE